MTTPRQGQSASLIEFSSVSKSYGSLAAADQLSFQINTGEIHAIIGENGAGKTTAMKILFGLEKPDKGDIFYKGRIRPWSNPRGAMFHAVGMVHQHFMLSPVHSALDNVILGSDFARNSSGGKRSDGWWSHHLASIDRSSAKERLQNLAQKTGFDIPWDEMVENLSVGLQQQIEIIKLLDAGVETMILDEPTAVLSPKETLSFLAMLRALKAQGKTIVLITHKLREVKLVADSVTIFRRGKAVVTKPNSDLDIQEMADLMVGRHVAMNDLPRGSKTPGEVLIDLDDLTIGRHGRKNLLTQVNLKLRAGEILGIAGVEGSGQSELWNLISGPRDYLVRKKLISGRIFVFGKNALGDSRHDIRKGPLAVVPADRLREAVLARENLVENDLLGHERDFLQKGILPFFHWLNRKAASLALKSRLELFDVRPADPMQTLGTMSGGNQQKFVMARELTRHPQIILCAEPTRGVDVGSIEFIHKELLKNRDQGVGVLLVSSQLDELMALSDRILVMFEGRIVAALERDEFSESSIGAAMGGVTA